MNWVAVIEHPREFKRADRGLKTKPKAAALRSVNCAHERRRKIYWSIFLRNLGQSSLRSECNDSQLYLSDTIERVRRPAEYLVTALRHQNVLATPE